MKQLKNMKILLIGGSGFVGLHLAKRLSELGSGISIFCRNSNKAKRIGFSNKIKFIEGDITDYRNVKKSISGKDVIINLASIVNDAADFNPYLDMGVNCKGQINILEARKNFNPNSTYIFIGTRSQFGRLNIKDLPVSEEHCQKPLSLYGIHKQTAENYCGLYKRAFNLNSIILRFAQVYGPSLTNEKTHSVIDKFIRISLKNDIFHVNGYGRDIKEVIYVDDAVDVIVKILESDVKEGVFNISSGKKIQLKEIAEKIIKICKSGSFRCVPFPEGAKKFELGSFYFDISKAKKTFKWEPKTSIDDGIKKTVEYYKKGR